MVRNTTLLVAVILLAAGVPLVGQTPENSPADVGTTEDVEVRYILIDTLVESEHGNTVPGLGKSDFQLTVDGTLHDIDSLDVFCDTGALAPAARQSSGEYPPAAAVERKIVILVDYYHLDQQDRSRVLRDTATMLSERKTADEEIMIAAIADGLRIEQRFTKDLDEALETLDRMNHDVTLFAVESQGKVASKYFESIATLMDVLEAYDGPKAVLLHSAIRTRGDLKQSAFDDVIERAAMARTTFYPGYARWMQNPSPRQGMERQKDHAGGQMILPTLAVNTGGWMSPATDDLSVAYVRAQRDLSCHYVIGFEIESVEAMQTHDIRVAAMGNGNRVHYPTRARLWSDEEMRQSRLRAAFADPLAYEHPLVRAHAFPVRPASGKEWETLLALEFPLPDDVGEKGFELKAALQRGESGKSQTYQKQFPVVPAAPASDGSRPVTLLANPSLRPGDHTLTLALSEPGRENVVTTQVKIDVPEMPKNGTFIRGPILSRIVREGILIREYQTEAGEGQLNKLLTDEESIELLLVQEAKSSDTLLSYWTACSTGKQGPSTAAVVERRILSEDGAVVHAFDPLPYRPEGNNKARCEARLDDIAAGTLKPGEYQLEIVVQDGDSEVARKVVPLRVN